MDHNTSPFIVEAVVFSSLLVTALALWVVMRLRWRSHPAPPDDMTGATMIPVKRLRRLSGFFGRSENSINPRLTMAPDGLRFKVFKSDHWPFSDIARVDAQKILFGTRLAIRHRSGAQLYADVTDAAWGRALLRALPPAVPVTQRATDLRDGAG